MYYLYIYMQLTGIDQSATVTPTKELSSQGMSANGARRNLKLEKDN